MPKKVSINELLLLCLFLEDGEASFTELTERCFEEFPERFSLKNHKSWPDTRKMDRPLRFLKEDNLITQRKKIKITKKGEKQAKEKLQLFKQQKLL